MTDPYFFDPLQLWRDAVSKLEKTANEGANVQLKSPGVARSLQDAATVSFGLQQAFAKATDTYLRQANLPSRKQVLELAETLQRMEEKLDRLLPVTAEPRPSRTRRPAAAATAPALMPEPAVAPPKVKAAATRTVRKTAQRTRSAATAKGAAVRGAKARPARNAKGRKG